MCRLNSANMKEISREPLHLRQRGGQDGTNLGGERERGVTDARERTGVPASARECPRVPSRASECL